MGRRSHFVRSRLDRGADLTATDTATLRSRRDHESLYVAVREQQLVVGDTIAVTIAIVQLLGLCDVQRVQDVWVCEVGRVLFQ